MESIVSFFRGIPQFLQKVTSEESSLAQKKRVNQIYNYGNHYNDHFRYFFHTDRSRDLISARVNPLLIYIYARYCFLE